MRKIFREDRGCKGDRNGGDVRGEGWKKDRDRMK
jgi:hypothetical protein